MPRIVRIVVASPHSRESGVEEVDYDAATVVVQHKPEGVVITPKVGKENTLGFLRLFYPWAEIRQIREFDRG